MFPVVLEKWKIVIATNVISEMKQSREFGNIANGSEGGSTPELEITRLLLTMMYSREEIWHSKVNHFHCVSSQLAFVLTSPCL